MEHIASAFRKSEMERIGYEPVLTGVAIALQSLPRQVLKGGTMRSELVFGAMRHISNRYLLTRVAAKAIRAIHRPNTPIGETASQVFQWFALENPVAPSPTSDAQYKPLELRRAS